jgi:hypothetical protein
MSQDSLKRSGRDDAALFEELLTKLQPILISYLQQNDAATLKPLIPNSDPSLHDRDHLSALPPSQLKTLFPRNLQLPHIGSGIEELLDIINITLHESTRTGSARFLDKLYAGTDPVGMYRTY